MTTKSPMISKYIVSKSGTKNIENINAWYSHCQSSQLPYITIVKRIKYATVEWDYINLLMELDAVISTKENFLLDGFNRIYIKYSNPKSLEHINSNFSRFTDIEVDKAELLASDLYDFVTEILGLGPRLSAAGA